MRVAHAIFFSLLLALASLGSQAADNLSGDFYNQGNAHARAREWGPAVVDYQRARLLAPNDPDVEANLRFVQAAAKVQATVPGLLQRLTRLTTPNAAALLGLLGLLLAGGSLVWLRPLPRLAAWLISLPLMAFAIGHALGLRPLLHTAVVVGGPATVQASPVPMADTLFSLPEATSVTIVAERPDYLLVTAQAGATGWVPRAHLVAVVPAR